LSPHICGKKVRAGAMKKTAKKMLRKPLTGCQSRTSSVVTIVLSKKNRLAAAVMIAVCPHNPIGVSVRLGFA
jgi:hypothetical protein